MENTGAHAAVASGAAPQSRDKAAPSSSRTRGLTLRAGVDGATARVQHGAVVAYVRVLADALDATDCDELPLPGKSKTELDAPAVPAETTSADARRSRTPSAHVRSALTKARPHSKT
jgi:hypothetical protein